MKHVLFVVYPSRTDARDLAESTMATLEQMGYRSQLHLVGGDAAPDFEATTLIVSLGGDGTYLHAARLAHTRGAVVLGVNLGRVGFLLTVAPTNLISNITSVLDGTAAIEERVVVEVAADGYPVYSAVNEIVLERDQPGHMVRVTASVNGDQLLTYSADGVMVATPTGSTGYSFSSGGPVLATDLKALVLTPVAPHFTINRSIVVSADSTIELEVLDRSGVVVADGNRLFTLSPGESIRVSRSPESVKVAIPPSYGFGERLRKSLREGHE
ncbi:MAG: NAD(+)/NADH kinase [Acidobacteria bacterium]|nr:NAD(+)/NADH kinase [Acidobacteriota bacterium]